MAPHSAFFQLKSKAECAHSRKSARPKSTPSARKETLVPSVARSCVCVSALAENGSTATFPRFLKASCLCALVNVQPRGKGRNLSCSHDGSDMTSATLVDDCAHLDVAKVINSCCALEVHNWIVVMPDATFSRASAFSNMCCFMYAEVREIHFIHYARGGLVVEVLRCNMIHSPAMVR